MRDQNTELLTAAGHLRNVTAYATPAQQLEEVRAALAVLERLAPRVGGSVDGWIEITTDSSILLGTALPGLADIVAVLPLVLRALDAGWSLSLEAAQAIDPPAIATVEPAADLVSAALRLAAAGVYVQDAGDGRTAVILPASALPAVAAPVYVDAVPKEGDYKHPGGVQ